MKTEHALQCLKNIEQRLISSCPDSASFARADAEIRAIQDCLLTVKTTALPEEMQPSEDESQHSASYITGWNDCRASMIDLIMQTQHPDDIAVDRLASAMKAKMLAKRQQGVSGWDKPQECKPDMLRALLTLAIKKGDPVDVGNYAMMLFNRNEPTAVPAQVLKHG